MLRPATILESSEVLGSNVMSSSKYMRCPCHSMSWAGCYVRQRKTNSSEAHDQGSYPLTFLSCSVVNSYSHSDHHTSRVVGFLLMACVCVLTKDGNAGEPQCNTPAPRMISTSDDDHGSVLIMTERQCCGTQRAVVWQKDEGCAIQPTEEECLFFIEQRRELHNNCSDIAHHTQYLLLHKVGKSQNAFPF